ncbi:MAG: type II CAAX endopeptidase family protein [Asticcacaulis sp.]|uniref:CPBP family intramembrane glutamic endopeptidase n=1 Tax=Asticcacaulis sp. TaxID=1872648 RepID=UPI0039E25E3C
MAGIELYAPRTERTRRTWTWAIIVLTIMMTSVFQILTLLPFIIKTSLAIQANPALAKQPIQPDVGAVEMFFMTAPLIGFILLWAWLFERRKPAAIGFNGRALWRLGRGYLIGSAFLTFIVCGLWALGVYQVEKPGVIMSFNLAGFVPIIGYAFVFLVQGASEETAMRGWLMATVASRHGIVWGVIINAVIFGALHLLNAQPSPALFAGCANVALFGVFISLYALKERSLWGVCAWHGAWNWLLGVGFGLEVSGLNLKVAPLIVDLKDNPSAPWWLSGGSWGPEASLLTTAVLAGGITWLVWKGALKSENGYPAPQKAVETTF